MVGWLEGWKGLPPRHLIERPGVFQKSTPQSKMNQTRRRHSAHLSFVRENLLHWTNWRPSIGTHGLVLWVCAYLALLGNTSFLSASTAGRHWADPGTWLFAAALVLSLIALHALIFGLLANRWIVRPLLTALVLATAFATFFMQRYGVYYDPSMLRNVLRTDTTEASELLSASLLLHVLAYSLVPVACIWGSSQKTENKAR